MAVVSARALLDRLGASAPKLFAGLTIRYMPKKGPPIVVKLWDADGANMILPRAMTARLRAMGCLIETERPERPAQYPAPVTALSPNQAVVCARVAEIFTPQRAAEGTACAILDMPPGRGKTITAAAISAAAGQRALFIVFRVALATQALDDFTKYFGAASPIETIVVNSALKRPDEWFDQFGTIIVDEVHAYCSEKRRRLFRRIRARYVLGMSGTIGQRVDAFDKIYITEWAVDGVIRAVDLPGWTADEVKFTGTARAVKYYGPDEFTRALIHESTGMIFTPYMYEMFAQDPARMRCIVAEVQALFNWRDDAGRQHGIFVFCETREFVEKLAAALAAVDPLVYAPEIGRLMGGSRNADEIKNRARVIVTTYGYSSVGISIARMTAMVLATPRRNGHRQICARVTRRDGDPAIPRVIVDIVDARTALRGQYYTRRKVYDEMEFGVVSTKVLHGNI